MTRQPIGHHGPTHLPWGEDPIPGLPDHVIWPTGPTILPFGGLAGPYISQSATPPPDDWNIAINTGRRNNILLSYTTAGTGKMIWPLVCGPGNYTLWIDGGGTGALSAYLAGAYGPNKNLDTVLPGDWILQSSWTLAAALSPELRRIQDFCVNTGGQGFGVGWSIVAADGFEGVSTLYERSTGFTGGGALNGGPGYFFLRLDVTPTFEVSELNIEYNEP